MYWLDESEPEADCVEINADHYPSVTDEAVSENTSSRQDHDVTFSRCMQQDVSTTQHDEEPETILDYTVRVIIPRAATTIRRLKMKKYTVFDELKSWLASECFDDDTEFSFGYIKRGHGMNGRQIKIDSEDTLAEMYEDYRIRKKLLHVNMWAKSVPKRKRSQQEATSSSEKQADVPQSKKGNYQSHLSKLSEVEIIIERLEEHHEGSDEFSVEQFRVWAHMIQMKKHDSYDYPPNKPFFRQRKTKSVDVRSPQSAGLSPSKKVHLRTELIDQLSKWHSLLESGAITKEQYQKIQDTIILDVNSVTI